MKKPPKATHSKQWSQLALSLQLYRQIREACRGLEDTLCFQTVVSKPICPPPGMAGPMGLRGLGGSRLGFQADPGL